MRTDAERWSPRRHELLIVVDERLSRFASYLTRPNTPIDRWLRRASLRRAPPSARKGSTSGRPERPLRASGADAGGVSIAQRYTNIARSGR